MKRYEKRVEQWTAMLSWGIAGCVVSYIRRDRRKRDTEAATWPAYVREYLLLDQPDRPHASSLDRETFDTLAPSGAGDIIRVRQIAPLLRLVTFRVTRPAAPRPIIVASDWDEAEYVGDGKDGCYVNVGQGRDGWYVTVTVDSNSGGFTDTLTQDDGPYPTQTQARDTGYDVAREWCLQNEVLLDSDDGRVNETPGWDQ